MDPDPARHRRRAAAGADARARSAPASIDRAFLARYTNAPQLVVLDDGERDRPVRVRPGRRTARPATAAHPHNKLWWDRRRARAARYPNASPTAPTRRSTGSYTLRRRHAGRSRRSSCCASASTSCTPEWAAASPASRRERSAGSRASWASRRATQRFELPIAWTDSWGSEHETVHGQPGRVPRDARARRAFERLPDDPRARGPDVAARHHRPARRLPPQGAVPARTSSPNYRAFNDPAMIQPNTPLERGAARLAGQPGRSLRSTTTARRCASTRRSRGSTRCRRTA